MLDLALDENLETPSSAASSMSATTAWRGCSKHEAGVVALCDAGAHLIYMCDAGFGLHFLARWVRERGDFDIVEGIRRLTSHPADLYGIQNRGRIAVGAQADLLLFDPATVGVSPAERVADLPGGGRRTIRRPTGVHGVFCNGVMTFDGKDYVKHAKGPGQVLDRFNASRGGHNLAIAAQYPRRLDQGPKGRVEDLFGDRPLSSKRSPSALRAPVDDAVNGEDFLL